MFCKFVPLRLLLTSLSMSQEAGKMKGMQSIMQIMEVQSTYVLGMSQNFCTMLAMMEYSIHWKAFVMEQRTKRARVNQRLLYTRHSVKSCFVITLQSEGTSLYGEGIVQSKTSLEPLVVYCGKVDFQTRVTLKNTCFKN